MCIIYQQILKSHWRHWWRKWSQWKQSDKDIRTSQVMRDTLRGKNNNAIFFVSKYWELKHLTNTRRRGQCTIYGVAEHRSATDSPGFYSGSSYMLPPTPACTSPSSGISLSSRAQNPLDSVWAQWHCTKLLIKTKFWKGTPFGMPSIVRQVVN